MKFHGIAGSEFLDKQGETLSVDGADISSLALGGIVNDNHQKGFFNTLGTITYAKKMKSKEDASTKEEKYFWEKVKTPCIYVQGELFDDDEHPNSKAAAAVLKASKKSPNLFVKASVEGKVLAKNKLTGVLERTFVNAVALTLTPVNTNTLIEPMGLTKSLEPDDEKWLELAKSLATTEQSSSFIEVSEDFATMAALHTLKKAISSSFFPTVTCPHCGASNTVFSTYQKACNSCRRNFSFREVSKILEKL